MLTVAANRWTGVEADGKVNAVGNPLRGVDGIDLGGRNEIVAFFEKGDRGMVFLRDGQPILLGQGGNQSSQGARAVFEQQGRNSAHLQQSIDKEHAADRNQGSATTN